MLNKHRRTAGVTLVELIVAMVIMGVALAGMVAVYAATTRASADPVITQQMEAIADNMMEEILMKPFAVGPGTGARVNFDDVRDYNGYDTGTGGIVDVEGNVIPGLENYEVAVTATTNVTLSGINAGDAIKVTVTVTNLRAAQGDTNRTITLVGWRTNPS